MMKNGLIPVENPQPDEDSSLEIIAENILTPQSSDDEIESIDFKKRKLLRRKGSVFKPADFHKTRGEVIKDVNLELMPVIQVIFTYIVLLSSVYWFVVISMPPFYVRDCGGNTYNYSLTVFISVFFIFTCTFEYKMAQKIVKIIQPLSGHSRLGNMQYLKLGLGFLGKLDIYTKYCFVLMAHKCGSRYAWIATVLLAFWCTSLISITLYNYVIGGVNFLQFTDYFTLFDLLGKYEIMYLEGEKSDAHKLLWTKRLCMLPVMKLFIEDIPQFIIQILFLIEISHLKFFVLVSLIVSLLSSTVSVSILYLKYRIFKPSLDKERMFLHCVVASVREEDFEKFKKLLGSPNNFRKYDHEVRAEVFKHCAKYNFEIFEFLATNYIVKNDGLLQSESFHAKLINSLRNCNEYPEQLIHALHLLTNEKSIYLNINKKISISTEGTILHCLVEDPCLILRTLKSQNFDLIKYVVYLGIDVNIPDKFGETALTLAGKLNLNSLIKSCSTKKLMELFKLNELKMNKEELNHHLKLWATNVVEYLVTHGAVLSYQNRKRLNVLQIAEQAENSLLCNYLYKEFGVDSGIVKRKTTQYNIN
jgi:hypothetical protein